MIRSNTRYDWRLDLIRNHTKIGEAKIESMQISYVENAAVTRTMRAKILENGFKTSSIEVRHSGGIFFDGTRFFDGTWCFDNGDYWTRQQLEFDMFSDRIRPVMVIDDVEHNFGDFMIIAAPKTDDGKEKLYDIEAYDETMLLSQSSIPTRKFFGAGTQYLTIIKSLLMECGINKVYEEPTTLQVTADHEYPIGTSYLTIVNGLLEEINYSRVYAGAGGYIYLMPNSTKTSSDYSYTDENSSVIGTIKTDTDIYSLPNVIVGYVSNPDIPNVLKYTRINDNPKSVISTVRRGYNVVEAYQFDDCPDLATLGRVVDQKFLDASQATETANIETLPDGNHAYGSYINLGIDGDNKLFREVEWTITAGGNMTHKLERKVFV